MARFTTHRPGARKPGPKDSKDLYWRVVKGKKNSFLEIFLLGLFSLCIGVLFFLLFFGV